MSGATQTSWLEHSLTPLQPYLSREDVTDLWINQPHEIWLETITGKTERFQIPELCENSLHRLVEQIAAANAQGISREFPILSAALPSGDRLQAIIPPATRRHMAIAIRKYTISAPRLADYAEQGLFPTAQLAKTPKQRTIAANKGEANWERVLSEAVQAKKNILISGGTSTGKTTFLNALLAEIPTEERLIYIEDTPELKPLHPNLVCLLSPKGGLSEAEISANDLLEASLRMRPSRIILGEIRGDEAATLLRALNTGHPGSMSTIHADSAHKALEQLAMLVLQSGVQIPWPDLLNYVRGSFHLVVQLGRVGGARRIVEILELPTPFNGQNS